MPEVAAKLPTPVPRDWLEAVAATARTAAPAASAMLRGARIRSLKNRVTPAHVVTLTAGVSGDAHHITISSRARLFMCLWYAG